MNIKINEKIMPIAFATLMGAGLGAYLSFGPLQKFKSEATLNIEMDTSDYKKITELANDEANLFQYAANAKKKDVSAAMLEALIKETKRADWQKPVLRLSKSDNKDEENNRKREQEADSENEKIFGKALNSIKNDTSAYVGLKISALASESQIATDKTKWLSEYVHNLAATGALNIVLAKWENENKFFAERFQAKKIQNEFEIEQLKAKIASLKKSIENYPAIIQKEVVREIEVGRDQTKTMTPMAQMLSAELDLLDVDIKNQKLNRANEQHIASLEILKQVAIINPEIDGMNRLTAVSEMLNTAVNKAEIQSKREKLSLMEGEVSYIKFKLIKKTQYISPPSVPLHQDGPAPIKLVVLMGILFAVLMTIYLWRGHILKIIIQNGSKLIT